jgi:hypothetical protein
VLEVGGEKRKTTLSAKHSASKRFDAKGSMLVFVEIAHKEEQHDHE